MFVSSTSFMPDLCHDEWKPLICQCNKGNICLSVLAHAYSSMAGVQTYLYIIMSLCFMASHSSHSKQSCCRYVSGANVVSKKIVEFQTSVKVCGSRHSDEDLIFVHYNSHSFVLCLMG